MSSASSDHFRKGVWDCDAKCAIPPEVKPRPPATPPHPAAPRTGPRGAAPDPPPGRCHIPSPPLASGAPRTPPAPQREAEVFEEVATMDLPFEGIPTVPPGKDRARMAFYCGAARYLVTASPEETAAEVKRKLFRGGISNSDSPARHTPGINEWRDLELIYAGQLLENDRPLRESRVPAGCKALLAVEGALLRSGRLPRDHPYWN